MKILTIFSISMWLIIFSLQVHAEKSAQDIARAYYEGKTISSAYGGGKLTIEYKKNGRVFGRYNQYTSTGRYEISKDGTTCVKWDAPGWKNSCHIFGTGAAKIQ